MIISFIFHMSLCILPKTPCVRFFCHCLFDFYISLVFRAKTRTLWVSYRRPPRDQMETDHVKSITANSWIHALRREVLTVRAVKL